MLENSLIFLVTFLKSLIICSATIFFIVCASIYFNQSPVCKPLQECLTFLNPNYRGIIYMFNFTQAIQLLSPFWKQSLNLSKWNKHSWDVGSAIYNLPYEELTRDSYLRFGLWSEPVFMYMKLQKDKSFAEILRREISLDQLNGMIQKYKDENSESTNESVNESSDSEDEDNKFLQNNQRDSQHYAEMLTTIRDMVYA
jgi:hypothetical protein